MLTREDKARALDELMRERGIVGQHDVFAELLALIDELGERVAAVETHKRKDR